MYVKQVDFNRFLFQFYHEIDIKRVCDGSPWTFGRFHLVFERLRDGMDPRSMIINNLEIWVQLHGMGTGFMSQRVVTDIGNYLGKFIESDVNNFVGVWRDHFRVRVSIPLDAPLKRRMKLRKSESEWCWVTFKYEAIPTFCFICGLVGHSDKFCSKLFDDQGTVIEKPYGGWMRADPKRRSHTMGSKWLRQGGTTPVNMTGEKERDKSNAVILADTEIGNGEKSGKQTNTEVRGNLPTDSEFLGVKGADPIISQQSTPFSKTVHSSETDNSNDNHEISFSDPKRRRMGQETDTPDEDMITSPTEESMSDISRSLNQNQKNLYLAGTAAQSRPSL